MDKPSSTDSSPFQNQKPKIPPINSTTFKKKELRRKRKERKRQEKLQLLLENWAPLTSRSLPVAPPTAPAASFSANWPSDPVSADHKLEPAAWDACPNLPLQAQPQPPVSKETFLLENAIRLCREFFAVEYGSDEEVDGDVKSYDFFKGLFDKETDLREIYRRDSEKGEFCCIVCVGIGEKLGKRFVGLAAVAQHANTVCKTRRRVVHRAYGRVICELIGLKSQDECELEADSEDSGEDDAV